MSAPKSDTDSDKLHENKDKKSPTSDLKAGSKRAADQLSEKEDVEPEVHSANSWETVNLGDDERKKKFLRLMGASKKGHHGRFVIGDSHVKHTDADESAKKSAEVEKQYTETMDNKLNKSRRVGIGFSSDKPGESKSEDNGSSANKSEGSNNDSKTDSTILEHRAEHFPQSGVSTTDEPSVASPLEKYKKMAFVKGSS